MKIQPQLLVTIATTCLVLTLWPTSYAQKHGKPITRQNVANACKLKLDAEDVTILIQEIKNAPGIAFPVNDTAEQEIRKDCSKLSKQQLDELIKTIRSLEPKPIRVVLTPITVNVPTVNQTVIYIGNSIVVSENPFCILIKMADEETLSFQRNKGGLVINGVIRDSHNSVIVRIANNVFSAPSNSDYEIKTDGHTVSILDRDNKAVLFIQYINSNTIKVLGRFYYPGLRPIFIEEDKQIVRGITYSGNIFYVSPLVGGPEK